MAEQRKGNKPKLSNIEKRTFTIQLRAAGPGDPVDESRNVTGYAAIFNSASEDMGFIEIIEPGAFTNAIPKSDVRALFNHDPNYILARTASGTLQLEEDEVGLKYRFEIPNTTFGNDFKVMLERGDVNQSSFAFSVKEQSWETLKLESGEIQYTRRIKEVDWLYDVSPVTYPAYADTTVALRSMPTEGNSDTPPEEPAPEPSRKTRLIEAMERTYSIT